MNNDEKLQHDIEEALRREPLLIGAELGVTVRDGTVTLTGTVDSYAKKRVAEHAVKSVKGVKAVIERIEVSFSSIGHQTDSEIVKEVLKALKSDLDVPEDQIQVQVEHGWVLMEGTVQWNAQKQAANNCIENIIGIKAVANNIIIRSGTEDELEKLDIQDELARNWAIDEKTIKVDVFGNSVTLTGSVSSLFQKEEAERMAWKASGVWNVHNKILVDYLGTQN